MSIREALNLLKTLYFNIMDFNNSKKILTRKILRRKNSICQGFNKAAGNFIANIISESLVKDKDEENQEPYPYQYPYQDPYQVPYGDSDIDRQDDLAVGVGEGVSLVSIVITAFMGAIIGQLAVTFYGDSLFQNIMHYNITTCVCSKFN